MASDVSTVVGVRDVAASRRARKLRATGLAVLLVFVLCGSVGLLGPRGGVVGAEGGDYELTVHYTQITRQGMDAPLELEIRRAGGFAGPVSIAVDRRLLESIDFNSRYPQPDTETGDPERVVFDFDPPRGNQLTVTLDSHTAPTQWPHARTYSIGVLEGGQPAAMATFRMWVLP
jgi:hypothetical protein